MEMADNISSFGAILHVRAYLEKTPPVARAIARTLGAAAAICLDTLDSKSRSRYSATMGQILGFLVVLLDETAFVDYIADVSANPQTALRACITLLDMFVLPYPDIVSRYSYATYIKRAAYYIEMDPTFLVIRIEREQWNDLSLESRDAYMQTVIPKLDD